MILVVTYIGTYGGIPTSYVWDQKFAIFILLWISLTFNLQSNEMLSDFLIFNFFLQMLLFI